VGLFGGKLPEVSIQLERADGVYYPGETVRARVTVVAEDGAKFKEIRAGLLFEEKYQIIDRQRDSDGDVTYNHVWRTNEQWARREQLASAGLPKGFRQTYDYEWRLPDDPHPFCQAKIVVARWLVKATVDRTLARDVNAEAPLYVVRPSPVQLSQGGELVEENTAPEAASMRFRLQRLEYVQGETVAGRLIVEPRQDLNPRALKINLLRHEVVPVGDRTNIENVVEAEQQHNVQLRAGQPVALDFAFALPAKWRPTYASGNASVAWRVNATLDLPWKRDVHAWQTVRVFNGAPRTPQPPPSEADPQFCRQCGGPLVSDALFCGNCGTQVLRS
jgi:Arrestin (or S-antigen), N-terminal domain